MTSTPATTAGAQRKHFEGDDTGDQAPATNHSKGVS